MKAAHEILLEEKASSLQRAAEEKEREAMLADCKASIWPGLIGVIAWPLLMALLLSVEMQGDRRPLPALVGLPLTMFFVSLGQLVAAYRKRERAAAASGGNCAGVAEGVRPEITAN